MAEDLAHQQPALPGAKPLIERRETHEDRRLYRLRFVLAYLGLAIVAGIGIGGAIVLYDRAPKDANVAWSDWHPTGRESSYPRQIAAFIGNKYKLPSGNPLVGVLASRAEVPTGDGTTVLPIRMAAIFNDPAGDQSDYTSIETNDTVMYTLCGFGQGCAIQEGKPSAARLLLLEREALELALYSFKYVDGLDTVITLLPTNLGDPADTSDDTSTTLFFQKKDFDHELGQPFVRTLPEKAPTLGKVPEAQQLTIERLTSAKRFRYQFSPTPTNTLVMLLIPIQ